MSALTRPPIESMRPVVSFAAVRLLLPVAALLATAILGFPNGAPLVVMLGAVAVPWGAAIFLLARRHPSVALNPWVAAGDFAVLAAIEAAVPETYGAVHFVGLVFIAAHAHFQGLRRGILIAGLGAAALIGVAIARPGLVQDEDLAFYETIYAVSALAIAAVIGELRGFETAGRLRARELSRRTIVGEDEVRRHVADFIHDGPVQELIGLDLILQGAVKAIERGDVGRATELIRRARTLAEGNVHLLRDEIVNLGPYAFEELSFEIAIERCIPVWRRRYGCEVTVDGNVELEPQVANDLFRITQEAVANACKHGKSNQVHVTVAPDGNGYAELRVVDNGKGFGDIDPFGQHQPGHIGLASMRERAELLNATLDVATKPGRTEVLVRVPVGGTRRRNRR
jgi:signal transduction histidine kinase